MTQQGVNMDGVSMDGVNMDGVSMDGVKTEVGIWTKKRYLSWIQMKIGLYCKNESEVLRSMLYREIIQILNKYNELFGELSGILTFEMAWIHHVTKMSNLIELYDFLGIVEVLDLHDLVRSDDFKLLSQKDLVDLNQFFEYHVRGQNMSRILELKNEISNILNFAKHSRVWAWTPFIKSVDKEIKQIRKRMLDSILEFIDLIESKIFCVKNELTVEDSEPRSSSSYLEIDEKKVLFDKRRWSKSVKSKKKWGSKRSQYCIGGHPRPETLVPKIQLNSRMAKEMHAPRNSKMRRHTMDDLYVR
jgi:hypothetical protein